MGTIRLVTNIRAPRERCFDLARSVDVHVQSTGHTGERAVAGVTAGLLNLGDEVTWHARHLGVWQRLTSRITALERPQHFRDAMVRGAFTRFDHDHDFVQKDDTCVMTDVFDYTSPLGVLGRLVDWLLLDEYLEHFLRTRNELLRTLAESDGWRRYLP